MTTIDDFCQRHQGADRSTMDRLATRWEREAQLDELLGTSVAGSVTIGDLMVGDGLRDQVSPELLKGFHELMGGKADNYDKVRQILFDRLADGHASVFGMVNKIKGQVGENWFMDQAHHLGLHARLADLHNQEAWDVAIDHAHGPTQYVQVKMYQNPNGIVEQIKEVHDKLQIPGRITDGGHAVHAIDFAIPADAVQPVHERVQAMGLHTNLIAIPHTAEQAGHVVQAGFDNVGPDVIAHLFSQLFVTSVSAAGLYALARGFLMYKGAKNADNFLSDTASHTSVTVAGVAAGMGVESVLSHVAWIGWPPTFVIVLSTSITTRSVLRRVMSRQTYVEWLAEQNRLLGQRLAPG